jgi:hypothetical protein
LKLPRGSVAVLCGVVFSVPLPAADEPVDPDFLEFLGSVDSNDIGWNDYLATTDVEGLVQSHGGAAKGADPQSPPPANDTGKVKPP